jgi:hypothetical protein
MKNYLMLENRIGFGGVGAQFIVSKKNILKKTKEFYSLNIVKMLEQFEPD